MAQSAERSRARDRLRTFYGVSSSVGAHGNAVGASQPAASSKPAAPSQPAASNALKRQTQPGSSSSSSSNSKALDIDGSGFDSKTYLKNMLSKEGVAGLLRVDNQLVGEMRQIDGDMKTMVYENYSKFISAAETIRRIQHDADMMDMEMGRLSERVRTISAKMAAVDGQFAGRREQIRRLSRERQQLSSLQFLFDLPDQLSMLIGRGQFVEAAKAWARTQPLLEHYRQLGVFAAVEKDGKEIMASVEAAIWTRWRHANTGIAQGAECASLLVLLHPDHAPRLWRDYLAIQSAKNRACRQAFLDQAYAFPAVRRPAAAVSSPAMADPDMGGTAPPTVAFPTIADATSQGAEATRASHFNDCYLSEWSSLVIGFASQFISPARSGLLEHVSELLQPDDAANVDAAQQPGRTMSLLEATTEGTVVGLLSPISEETAANASSAPAAPSAQARRRDQLVVGWQAMEASELAEAQQAFGDHLREWASEYEFIVDSLLELPDDPAVGTVDPYLEQLDRLVASIDEHPILVRIGGLQECVYRVVKRWQQQLVEGVLHTIIRDMIERLEYYFDPSINMLDTGAIGSGLAAAAARVSTPPLLSQAATVGGAAARRSSVSRHQRNLSATSVGSQSSLTNNNNNNQHQRSGSVLSNTWSGLPGDRGTPRNSVSSMAGVLNVAQSPLMVNTQSQNARGLAHARAVSSAFEALGNHPAAGGDWTSDLSLSPSVGPFGIPGAQRLSRASTVNHSANRASAQNTISGARAGVLRRAHRQPSHTRTLSSALADMAEMGEETIKPSEANVQPQQPLRRSLSVHRGPLRRYRPWLVGTVNRNAPLHVFLADAESWLIQQVLERVNPLLERVVQHYLDIEGSQILDDADDDDGGRRSNRPKTSKRLPLQSAAKMRQSFIRTLDECLDKWMCEWIPDAFMHASLARPLHGTREYVDKEAAESTMAQFGVAAIADPVVSLLLARFAADFELTLTQSIYQLCEHSIAITPDDGTQQQQQQQQARRDPNTIGGGSIQSSADVSMSNLLGAVRGEQPGIGDSGMAERLHSLTASAHRADSFASSSRRGTLAGARSGGGMLNKHQTSHSAKWRSVAEGLVRNFVMTVGQDISSDYLKVHSHYNNAISTDDSTMGGGARQVESVSDVWLSICRWMKQVEDDTNALFYDPAFSATLKALDANRLASSGDGRDGTDDATARRRHSAQLQANQQPASAHAHILSNIDRLFAERVDVFPQTISPLNAGQILLHLAMQIIKTALEALRLRPPVLRTRAEFQQVIVDATFVRSWMLRYAGVAPALGSRSNGTIPVAPAKNAADDPPAVNERDVRAVRNLIDDWIASAKACALVPEEPSNKVVEHLVFDAWMSTYFNARST